MDCSVSRVYLVPVDSPAAMTAFIKLASKTSFHTITPSVPVAFMSRVFVCPGSPGVFEPAAFIIGCLQCGLWIELKTTRHTQKSQSTRGSRGTLHVKQAPGKTSVCQIFIFCVCDLGWRNENFACDVTLVVQRPLAPPSPMVVLLPPPLPLPLPPPPPPQPPRRPQLDDDLSDEVERLSDSDES